MAGRLAVVMVGALCLAGCLASGAGRLAAERVDVFGVAFGAAVDYRELAGVAGTDEPCLRGFERSFDPLAVTVGYGTDGRVRRLVTRNPATDIFGVRPGMARPAAERLLEQAGLARDGQRPAYRGAGVTVTLLADGAGTVFGITLEADD